jgi:type I restriction enzyme S subunit
VASRGFEDHILAMITGSAVPHISGPQILSFPIRRLPAVQEQGRIAATLRALDDKIESNRRCVSLTVQLAQAALLSGSRQVRLGDIATLDKGVSYKGAGLVDRPSTSARPLIKLGNFPVDSGWLNRSKTKFYSGDYRDRHVVQAGDLVVANTDLTHQRAVLGRAALVPAGSGPALLSHHVFAVRFHARQELRLPLWAQLGTPSARERLTGYATGTTVAGLPREALLDFRVLVPMSIDVIATAEALVAAAWAREKETASLLALRDALLPELLSGRMRVPEAARD